jgi:alginate O-acetyltransferase complex protein AlgI
MLRRPVIFLTYWFAIFGPAALVLYWVARSPRLRLVLLVLSCAVFHAHFAGPAGVLPILVLGALTYLLGLTRDRRLCGLGIAVCVLGLVFYKYTTFLATEVLAPVSPQLGGALAAATRPLMPGGAPLAISFFTFEFVHYLYDVGGGSAPIQSPLRFAAFAIFWPSIVAGPVKRYQQFLPALDRALGDVTALDVTGGLLRVALGLAKKLAADNLTAYVSFWDQRFEQASALGRWGVFLALGARILLDFSGYSDMAIGFARVMGVRLPENFAWPYLATSMQSFWQRWHISLSSWIRDYVYIPLGGSRRGPASRALNGLTAFALCGLWHGPAWHFVGWGVYHGVGLAVSATYRGALGPVGAGLGSLLDRAPLLCWALTFTYVMVGWLLFFYPVDRALRMLRLMVLGN